METPSTVLVHSTILGLKGTRATLLRVHDQGFFEVNMKFGEAEHRVMLPINDTVIIASDPELDFEAEGQGEIER